MKFFVRVTFFALICSISPVSLIYAQDDIFIDDVSSNPVIEGENKTSKVSKVSLVDIDRTLTVDEAKVLINESPEAADSVKGRVEPSEDNSFYDIYSRSLAYRENAKELRASLDERRIQFEEPRVKTIEAYRKKQEKVYAAEMAAYDKAEQEDEIVDSSNDVTVPSIPDSKSDTMENVAPIEEMAKKDNGDHSGVLNETYIPSEDVEEGSPKRKVITSEGSPDFDPSRL